MKAYDTSKLKETPQSEPSLNTSTPQVQNNAGGFVFEVDKWKRLERFLILGSEKGTYYVKEQTLTRDNAVNVIACIKENYTRVIDLIVEISDTGRAPKNTPALFALALCLDPAYTTPEQRNQAYDVLPKVARIGTHFLNFVAMVKGLRGFGRGVRKGLGRWYTEQNIDRLTTNMVKYRQRDGWSQADALRVIHPEPTSNILNALFKWIVDDEVKEDTPPLVHLFTQLQKSESVKETVTLITPAVTWEMIKTEHLADSAVWTKLVEQGMPMTALMRNLGRLCANGTLKPMSALTAQVVNQLTNKDAVHKSRIHPISVLAALMTYAQGRGMKGSLSWTVIPQIKDALDDMFYAAFDNVEPTGKRINLALDISSSMWGGSVAGMEFLDAATASAAMAMITARTEKNYLFTAFTNKYEEVDITAKDTLDAVIKKMRMLNQRMGRTDCSQPMLVSLKNKWEFDAFVIFTDNETWAGKVHPFEALKKYRKEMQIPAKMAVCATAATPFSIADPSDAGMMDFVGFDSAVPSLLSDFIK